MVSEAVDAISETQTALAAIEKGDKRKAIKALESVTGKLDVVLARDPELGFVPLESEVDILAFSLIRVDGHEEIVQSMLKEARKELKLAEELGYGDRDKQYASLDNEIKKIGKQISAGDRAEIAFSNLKDKLGGFFDRISS